HPEIILAGRRLNDSMGKYVANEVVKLMIKKDIQIKGSKALILGITFKENCPDIRNTRVTDIYHELVDFGLDTDIYDPWASAAEVQHEYGVDIINQLNGDTYEAIIIAVAHDQFKKIDFQKLMKPTSVVYDIKGLVDRGLVDARL
ncbi:MAG: UDP binding domain-containing protein, partial [Chitinophagales bacterium]